MQNKKYSQLLLLLFNYSLTSPSMLQILFDYSKLIFLVANCDIIQPIKDFYPTLSYFTSHHIIHTFYHILLIVFIRSWIKKSVLPSGRPVPAKTPGQDVLPLGGCPPIIKIYKKSN